MSSRKLMVAIAVVSGASLASSGMPTARAATARPGAVPDYPTTCQWNGCPTPGDEICLVAWNGHYICTKPYSRIV